MKLHDGAKEPRSQTAGERGASRSHLVLKHLTRAPHGGADNTKLHEVREIVDEILLFQVENNRTI